MGEDAREALLIGEVVGGLGSELAGSTYPQDVRLRARVEMSSAHIQPQNSKIGASSPGQYFSFSFYLCRERWRPAYGVRCEMSGEQAWHNTFTLTTCG
jgi:hypothetical protein